MFIVDYILGTFFKLHFLSGNSVTLKNYEADFQGFIKSWTDRFGDTTIDSILESIWNENKSHFPSLIS